jgi:UDP-N-acetylmuramate--alanine ligase
MMNGKGKTIGPIKLRVPGEFNKLNAAGVVIAANYIGLSSNEIKKGIESYAGIKRRFEKIGSFANIDLYDDYAHHPTEIQATLTAAGKLFGPRRIIAIFQPHTYSRTEKLMNEFAESFNMADIAIITDIYASAREKKNNKINSAMLVRKIKQNSQKRVEYLADKKSVSEFLEFNAQAGDVIITIGAGDIFTWHGTIEAALKTLKK